MKWPSNNGDLLRLAECLSSLIGGRKEVAARHFDFTGSDDTQKKGWAPWKGKREKKEYKPKVGELVGDFKNWKTGRLERRVLKPLSVDNLLKHLRGTERLGVYVLDNDEKCSFIAADFDDHRGTLDPDAVWAEVKKFWDTCNTHDWSAHIERSKSGKGYHVWIFFDEPIEAGKARAVGRWLFEESQTLRDEDDFSTFDRFFPAQAHLPPAGKGYGNLIGLPLSGPKDYEAGRCAWVNPESRKTISDPLEYTLAISLRGRNAAKYVDEFMEEWDLSVETEEVYQGSARDPDAPLGDESELKAVVDRCAFMQWASNPTNQDNVPEPLWFSLISNACRFDSEDWIHNASSFHRSYSPTETEIKIAHARTSSGPHTCKTIKELGFKGCPADGCPRPNEEPTSSPAGLAAWCEKKKKRKSKDRSVNVSAAGRERPALPDDIPLNEETKQPWPHAPAGWACNNDGVMQLKGDDVDLISLTPVWVDALTRNSIGQWGVSLKFFDLDWKLKGVAIPRERLHEQGGVLGRELAAWGLPIVPGKEKWVSRYIVLQESETRKRIRAAGRLGWFDAPESPAVFVMPEQVLGKAPEDIVYQPDAATMTADTLHPSGTLKEWQDNIATPSRGNHVFMFCIMLGMAGPLLKPCQEQSGGFHLYGVTTGGKTTAAQIAASVWGCGADPQEGPEVTSIRKWYTTGNALEGTAEIHNDTLLTLDEISEVDEYALDRIIYQLAGGLSKSRAMAGGGLRAMKTWRLLFLSTGEKSVRQVLASAGKNIKGGQIVRLPDIPADDSEDGSRSIVLDSHGRDPKEFVQDLKAACAKYYGLAGPVFTSYLIAIAETTSMAGLTGMLKEELRKLEAMLSEDVSDNLPPEGRRVIRRFALVALAGSHAIQAGIVDWELSEVIDAVKNVLNRWMSEQGQERSETDRALHHLRDELIASSGKFIDVHSEVKQGGEILGYRNSEYYMLTSKSLRSLCGDYDSQTILKQLKMKGLLRHEKDRLTYKAPTLPDTKTRPNMYWISFELLGELDVMGAHRPIKDGQRSMSLPEPPEEQLGGDDDIPF